MKVYTVTGTVLQVGAELTFDANKAPVVALGAEGRGRKLVLAPLPGGATVEGRTETAAGRLVDVPARRPEDEGACAVVIRDHSGFRGGWRLRGARPASEWEDIVAGRRGGDYSPERAAWDAAHPERPHGCRIVAEGRKAQGDAGAMGGGPEYLLVIPHGVAVEIVRTGRLYGAPSALRIECADGALTISDPREDAETRHAASNW